MTKRIPRLGQILLVTLRTASPEFFRYLVVVLQVQTDHRGKHTAITRVIAIKKDQVWNRDSPFPCVDGLHEVKINDLKANGHKIELVGIEYLPRCMAWHRRTTYERVLRREPLSIDRWWLLTNYLRQ